MKRKIFFVICSMFLLSGCTANYRLNLSDNGTIEEKVTISETRKVIATYTLDADSYKENILNSFNEEEKYNSYKLYYGDDNSNIYGYGSRIYLDFDNYKNNSIIIKEMFKDISISNNNGIVKIDMSPNNNFEYFKETTLDSALFERVNIEINLPYEVVYSNSDSNEENVYKWSFDRKDGLKKISISYDTNKEYVKAIPTTTWILICSGSVVLIGTLYIFIRYKRNGM